MEFISCLWAFIGCMGFALFVNVRGMGIFVSCFGGALGWACYLLAGLVHSNEIMQSLVAAIVISIYAESMARLLKCPVTAYLLIASIPLVPGGKVYYATEHAILGRTDQCIDMVVQVFGIAGAIALGVLLVSTTVRMAVTLRKAIQTRKAESA